MNKAELLAENTMLRQALYREERSRFTQRREDLLRENKEMLAELALYGRTLADGQVVYLQPKEKKQRRQVKRPLRGFRRLRELEELRRVADRQGGVDHWRVRISLVQVCKEAEYIEEEFDLPGYKLQVDAKKHFDRVTGIEKRRRENLAVLNGKVKKAVKKILSREKS